MKILSLFLLCLLFTVNSVVGQNSIQLAIEKFSNDPELKHASISFKVIDLEQNSTIADYHSSTTLPTASTAKLFSTATALDILGPNYKPTTRIYHDGVIDSSGVLDGNIWIRGGGDPTLGSKYFTDEHSAKEFLNIWATELKKFGINKIKGSIIADASEFGYQGAPDGWIWIDLGNYYGAGPSGLSIFDNMIKVHFKTSSTIGAPAKINSIDPEVSNMTFHNYVTGSTRKGDNVYIFGAPYSLDRFATGTLPANRTNFLVKGSLPDPEYQIGHEFQKVLNQHHISVHEGVKSVRQSEIKSSPKDYTERTLILEYSGEKLNDIIRLTNMRSINLFAEHMLNLSGYEKTGNGSTYSGLKVLKNHWSKHFSVDGLEITDGSGLARTNGISASHFTDLLKYMYSSKHAAAFKSSLPVAGKSGTLRNVCKGQSAHGRMAAKSGSMNRVRSYAGYIDSVNGKKYAFALIVNNQSCSSSSLRRKMEVVFNKIAAQ